MEHRCHVCGAPAFVEVLLYDIYTDIPHVKAERDFTCPYLCSRHMSENEAGATTEIRIAERDVTLGAIADAYPGREGDRPPTFSRVLHDASGAPDVVSAADMVADMQNLVDNRVNVALPAIREARGFVSYPYTNQHRAQGFTIYRELPEAVVQDEEDTSSSEY